MDKFEQLVEIIKILRSNDGCPWDREQTHISLKPMLVEECSELLDAIDNNDVENMKEELGDILMHTIFHAQIAEENGQFDINDVLDEINAKMVRRHPHIFGDKNKIANPDDVIKLWEEIKAEEKKGKRSSSILAGIPKNLPALARAIKMQIKAAKVGFDWEREEDVFNKIIEEFNELKEAYLNKNSDNIEEEIGDLLFSIVNLCRYRKTSTSEELLHKTINKFEQRFSYIERELQKENIKLEDAGLKKMDSLWNEAKKIKTINFKSK